MNSLLIYMTSAITFTVIKEMRVKVSQGVFPDTLGQQYPQSCEDGLHNVLIS